MNGTRRAQYLFLLIAACILLTTVTGASSINNNVRISPVENYSFFMKWGSYGSGNGYFNQPNGVAIDSSDNVYVVDVDNSRIQKFDCMGNFITKWGSKGTGNGQFKMPTGIAVDSTGNVYVTDWNIQRIQKFDSNGNYLTQWGSSGSGNGQFNQPLGITTDSAGNVYVADSGNHRIQKFDSKGNFLTKWNCSEVSTYPYDIAVDSSNYVYVADPITYQIYKFDNVGNFIKKWDARKNSDEAQLSRPYHIAVDSSSNVFVTNNMHLNDYTYTCVQKFDNDGNFITKWCSYGTEDGQICRPQGIDVNSTGYVFVSDDEYTHRITVFQKDKAIESPVAGFYATPKTGKAPLSVRFKDISTGSPTKWNWDFGDGTTSTVKLPTHVYSQEGKYTVTLTVSNAAGSNTLIKKKYIIITTNTRPGIYSMN